VPTKEQITKFKTCNDYEVHASNK